VVVASADAICKGRFCDIFVTSSVLIRDISESNLRNFLVLADESHTVQVMPTELFDGQAA
jgi:hypothetical protein